jgi:FtsP/CotA-like multicopper oxidase with cupredoxin domain
LRRSLAAKRGTLDADSPTGGNACAPETDATPMINGAPMASIGIKPGETELFRVVNASGHRHFDLTVDGQQLRIVGQDGVPIGTYPGAPQMLTVSDVVVPPAGRVEFLVTGTSAPQALVSQCYQSGPAGDTDPEVALGVLTDDTHWPITTTQSVHVNRAIAALRRAQYYQSTLPAPAQQRTIEFEEDANGFYINNQAYSATAAPQVVAQSGTVEAWTLVNTTQEVHAFHIHQTHFIVQNVNGQAPTQPAHWLDTIDIPPAGIGVTGQLVPSKTTVLIDFRDPTIRGTFLFHCHILDHEDGGMMAKIVVQ